MNEEDIKAAAVELAQAARVKGLERCTVRFSIGSEDHSWGYVSHSGGQIAVHRQESIAEAIANLQAKIAALPSEKERNTRAAVEALEAARLACSKIDADDVAASLAALVTRLSEDLIEHKEGAA